MEHLAHHAAGLERMKTFSLHENDGHELHQSLRDQIKLTLKSFIHRQHEQHESTPLRVVQVACSEEEFLALFGNMPLTFHNNLYSFEELKKEEKK